MNTTETAVPVSLELLTDTLTAMHWVISPYTDGDTAIRDDYPWIYELALVYNKLCRQPQQFTQTHSARF